MFEWLHIKAKWCPKLTPCDLRSILRQIGNKKNLTDSTWNPRKSTEAHQNKKNLKQSPNVKTVWHTWVAQHRLYLSKIAYTLLMCPGTFWYTLFLIRFPYGKCQFTENVFGVILEIEGSIQKIYYIKRYFFTIKTYKGCIWFEQPLFSLYISTGFDKTIFQKNKITEASIQKSELVLAKN